MGPGVSHSTGQEEKSGLKTKSQSANGGMKKEGCAGIKLTWFISPLTKGYPKEILLSVHSSDLKGDPPFRSLG